MTDPVKIPSLNPTVLSAVCQHLNWFLCAGDPLTWYLASSVTPYSAPGARPAQSSAIWKENDTSNGHSDERLFTSCKPRCNYGISKGALDMNMMLSSIYLCTATSQRCCNDNHWLPSPPPFLHQNFNGGLHSGHQPVHKVIVIGECSVVQ